MRYNTYNNYKHCYWMFVATLFAFGCNPEQEAIDAQQYCQQEGLTFYSDGQISSEDHALDLSLSQNKVLGSITSQYVQVQAGELKHSDADDAYPFIVRFFDAQAGENLLDVFATKTLDGPLVLEVIDATEIGAGSQNRTNLSAFDCSVSKGTICAQVGLDLSGDELLLDDDNYVYNAASGTLTVHEVNNRRRTISMSWSLTTGANVLKFSDQSRGQFEGCMIATYDSGTSSQWMLR